MRTVRLFAALALIFVVGAAPAQAGTLRGYTHHGMSVRIKVDAQGYASRVVFRWHVGRCDFRRYSYRGDTAVTPDPERFFTRNPYTVRSRGGFRSRVTVHSNGRKLSIYRWKGTFSVAVTIRRHGRVVDRCHLRRLHWTASRPEIHLNLSSDPDDPALAGKSYSFSSPATRFGFESFLEENLTVYAPDVQVRFSAPFDHSLRRGHFRHVTKAGRHDGHAGLFIYANGEACEEVSGEITIRRVEFKDYELKRFSATFVQHCNGSSATARGTFTYRR